MVSGLNNGGQGIQTKSIYMYVYMYSAPYR